MSPPPQELRPASPSVTQLGTTTAHLWRMGRSLKSSSTPRSFTQVTLPAAGLPPPHHFPHHHGRGKCVRLSQGTGEVARPQAGPCRDSPSVLALDGQLSVLKLRAAGQRRARCCPPSVLCNCTCNALEPTLGWSRTRPLLQPAVWVLVPFRLCCSKGRPRSDLRALLPPEALAFWACTQSL